MADIEVPPLEALQQFLDDVHLDPAANGSTSKRTAYRLGESCATSDLTIEETFELLEQNAPDVLAVLSAEALGSIVRGYVDQIVRTRGLTQRKPGRLSSHVARLAALHRINRAATSSLRLDDVLATIVEAVAETIDGDACSVFLYDEHTQALILRATKGLNPDAIGRIAIRSDAGITGLAASTRVTQMVEDAPSHPAFFTYPLVGEERYTTQVSIPLFLREPERLIGVMNIQSVDQRTFDQDELTFLETAGGELAIAIENARLYSQTDDALHRRISELNALQAVSRSLAVARRPDELHPLIAAHAASIARGDAAAIFDAPSSGSSDGGRLAATGVDDPDEVFPPAIRERVETNRSAMAVTTGPDSIVLGAPLMTAHRLLGSVLVRTRLDENHVEEKLSLFQAFADAAALALENAELYEEANSGFARASTLLQEMHHRVRNNLQTVAALLSMQARHASHPAHRATLQEAVARVQSIAAVHNLLSAENLTSATVTSIVKHVVDEASINVVPPGKRVEFEIVPSDVAATSRQATILALLVNECVTNAIEHGMSDCQVGRIRVVPRRDGDLVELRIEDDGCGLAEGFNLERDSSLGLRIARTLTTADLKGTFAIGNRPEGGAVATIRFPAAVQDIPITR
ncbi:MAG TPA: GAF domain-containing protein [Thermomicrobiales bacterium]|nr:GAF domain-containing protein [Thermomicrobiales bacterium]